MKIALIIKIFSADKGGAERYSIRLADALINEGHEVHVFANRWDIPRHQVSQPVHTGKDIIFHHVPMGIGPRFLKLLFFHWNCQRQLKREQFDIIHSFAQTYPTDIYRMSDGLFLHWLSLQYPNPILRLFRCLSRPVFILNLILEKKIFRSGGCRMLIANSRLCRQQAESYYAVPPERMEVVYNGVDLETFHPGVKAFRSKIRKFYNISDDTPLLLFAAMNFSRKGLEELIRSLALVQSSLPGIRLMVIGRGDPRPYQKVARSLGTEEALIFVGPVKDLSPFYGAADLFVLPTHYDPFANVCLEAMACGLPVVTTRQNGASELIEEGANGYTIDNAGQIDELAKKIIQSLLNHSKMGERAAETAISFSQANHVQRILEVYRNIVSEKISAESISSSPFVVINSAFLPLFRKNGLFSYDQIMSYSSEVTSKRNKAKTTNFTLANGQVTFSFYIKRHRSPFLSVFKKLALFPFRKYNSEGQKEWKNIFSFRKSGLPTAVPVAMGERKSLFSEDSFLMTEALEGYESLESWIPSKFAALSYKSKIEAKRVLIKEIAMIMRRMHYAGFFNRDFYLTHIFIKSKSEGFELKIIDLQRVLYRPWFKRWWQIKDLASLNYSCPPDILTSKDRLKFYKFYSGKMKLNKGDQRLIKDIQKKSKRIERHTVKMYQKRERRRHLGLLER